MDVEQWLEERCREAGLTRLQTELVLLRYAERWPPSRIYRALHGARSDGQAITRLCDVGRLLGQAEALLASLPGFWDAARVFPAHLLQAAANRQDRDDRPAGVRGVTPAPASKRFQGMNTLSEDDPRLRQDRPAAIRLWVQAALPVQCP